MKRLLSIQTYANILGAMLLVFMPVVAHAEDLLPVSPPLPPLLITEIQPGTTVTASEEFIELYNTTDQVIDFGAFEWHLEVASTTATNWVSPYRAVTLSGSIAPHQTIIISSQYTSDGQMVHYLGNSSAGSMGAGISATAGHIRLTYTTKQLQIDNSCVDAVTVVDQVEWSTPNPQGQAAIPSLDGRALFVTPTTVGITRTTSLQRSLLVATLPIYMDSGNDAADFILGGPSPNVAQTFIATTTPVSNGMIIDPPSNGCDPNALPSGDNEAPPTTTPPDTEPPDDQNPGDDTTPPPSGPSDADVINAGLAAPQISEVLPDPVAPQTDAVDEFVELYNPNDAAFDVSGFIVEVGATTKHRYVFPAGTILAPNAYKAFFATDTQLSLVNANGQVVLIDPTGTVVAQTENYGTAKEGQSWIFANTLWQWTTTPTPNNSNIVTVPAAVKAKTATVAKAKTAAAKKTTAVKAATTKTPKPKKVKAETQKTATVASNMATPLTPLHPGVLAVAAFFALLYGTYEYRSDLANKLHQLRANRTARREARRIAERR